MVLSLNRSSLGWLESLKLSSAQCCLQSARPSVFHSAFASLSFFSLFFLSVFHPPLGVLVVLPLSLGVCYVLFSCLKTIRTYGSSIPLPPPVRSLATTSLGVPCSASSLGSQGVETCPPAAAPIHFVGLVFPLRHGTSLLPPWQSNRTSNLYKLRLNPPSIPFSHRARSLPLDLGPPDLTPYACFTQLTCSTINA